jgi:hypothetical protein
MAPTLIISGNRRTDPGNQCNVSPWPFTEYSIWYHRLTIDRQGRLLVSFDYWSTYWFYRTDHVGARRKTMLSADGGDSWQLLRTDDLR